MVRIISRDIRYSEDTGLTCGAFDESAIDAEIVLEDEGKRIFLYAQWTDQMPDSILMEAALESLYGISQRMGDRDADWEFLAAERSRIRKNRLDDAAAAGRDAPDFDELKRMVVSEMREHGYLCPE